MKKIFSLLLLFCFASTIGFAQGTWAPLVSGTTTTLLGVSTPSSALCFVCGATGTIRKTTNAGSTWNPLSSGTGQNLHSIVFIDVLTGFVVGDNGTALKTTNGGTSWSPMTVGTAVNLRFVYFFDSSNGFITGAGGLILKTIDGGTSWTSIAPGLPGNQLHGFYRRTHTGNFQLTIAAQHKGIVVHHKDRHAFVTCSHLVTGLYQHALSRGFAIQQHSAFQLVKTLRVITVTQCQRIANQKWRGGGKCTD